MQTKEYGIERYENLVLRSVPNDDALIQNKLIAHGWLPIKYDPVPVHDPDTHYHELYGYTMEQSVIVRHYTVVERPAEYIKEKADAVLKAEDIAANLPSWSQVETAIGSIKDIADAKVFLLKLAKIVYWNTKNDSV